MIKHECAEDKLDIIVNRYKHNTRQYVLWQSTADLYLQTSNIIEYNETYGDQ